eukprot:CAMPEP_0206148744 /NCGR_PEP_ID=MMETSP1473-20131121/37413_1 /ASSEMBLY_ACC=CAM_ASM_001109 /TAXON_ID=1461547 /ORGANISM="Stichococcus sp, Strain RCC1054" /LENGTH=95 /DNA_ID=CAMNT_0053546167 /DNA_START=1072 /DNA_END=1359 /DNA_ORIENTATION=-
MRGNRHGTQGKCCGCFACGVGQDETVVKHGQARDAVRPSRCCGRPTTKNSAAPHQVMQTPIQQQAPHTTVQQQPIGTQPGTGFTQGPPPSGVAQY